MHVVVTVRGSFHFRRPEFVANVVLYWDSIAIAWGLFKRL